MATMSWLQLKCDEVISFEPISKVTRCHFDPLNNMVFSVRSGGVTGVLGRCVHWERNVNFRLEEALDIVDLRMCNDLSILAMRIRSEERIVCVDVEAKRSTNTTLNEMRLIHSDNFFFQQCRQRAKLLQFAWTSSNELVLFTTQGIELYSVNRHRRLIRGLRNHTQSLHWVVFNPFVSVVVASAQEEVQSVSELSLLAIRDSYVVKVAKMSSNSPKGTYKTIRERDVNVVYTEVSRNSASKTAKNPASIFVAVTMRCEQGPEVHLHFFNTELNMLQCTHVLTLTSFSSLSNVGLNVVDNLIIVHQINKEPLVFDLASETNEESHIGQPTRLKCVCTTSVGEQEEEMSVEGRTSRKNWLPIAPNLILDAQSGILAKLKMVINPDIEMRPVSKLIHFLMHRSTAKSLLLIKLKVCLSDSPLSEIAEVFNILTAALNIRLQEQSRQQRRKDVEESKSSTLNFLTTTKVVLDQSELYSSLLMPLMEQCNERLSRQRLVAILLEFFRSLHGHCMRPQHFLNELLINVLVQNEAYYQLHQVLQYQVISDSKPLACLLLSLQSVYPYALQLALDMLARLRQSDEEIIEILLAEELVVEALRLAMRAQRVEPRKFLEEAMKIEEKKKGNQHCFHNVYTCLKAKRLVPEGKEEYEKYHRHFRDTFNEQQ